MTVADGTSAVERRLHLTGERLPFAMLPRWLLYHTAVNEGAKFLYCVLHDLVQGREGPTRPVTRAELAAACGVSADTIDRRLAQLVAVGAVDKEPQIRAGGQQANVYRVWLTPPDGLHRTTDDAVDNRGRPSAAPVEGGANRLVSRSRESAAPPPQPHRRGTGGRIDAAPYRKEEQEEVPPQPPRRAGGQEMDSGRAGPRLTPPEPEVGAGTPEPGPPGRPAGSNPRALGTNPRAEAEVAEAARLEAEAAARRDELEQAMQARRAGDLAAQVEADRLEAEALALSACLDDRTLAGIVELVTDRMAGPLARSPLAISRAVVAWCRTAAAEYPGPLAEAVAAGLVDGLAAGEGLPPLGQPVPPADTRSLRSRIAQLRHQTGGQ